MMCKHVMWWNFWLKLKKPNEVLKNHDSKECQARAIKKNSHATAKSKTYNLACFWLNASAVSYIANKTASSYNSLAKSKYSEAHSPGEITDHVIQIWGGGEIKLERE